MRLLFLLFALICGCQKSYLNDFNKPSPKLKSANAVQKKVAVQLKKEEDLYPCGTGAQMLNQIEMLALSFDYYQKIDIQEGRKLLLRCVDTFLESVNIDEPIRPYLADYPFAPENLQIRIFVHDQNYKNFGPGSLSVISIVDGVLEYDIRDPETDRLKTIYSETYEEAVQKIVAERDNMKL